MKPLATALIAPLEGSRYGLDDYLEIKYLCLGGIDA